MQSVDAGCRLPALPEETSMRFAVLPGDGIGPEITAATLEVLACLDRRLGLAAVVLLQVIEGKQK